MNALTPDSIVSLAPFTSLNQPCWRGTWHELKKSNSIPSSQWTDIETRLRVDGHMPLITGLQITLESGRRFQLHPLAYDHKSDHESWSSIGVFTFSGELPSEEGELDGEEILREIGRHMPIATAGGSQPGGPFADEPWIQYFPRLLIVSQRGGRDV
jgi:hypothetical protein